MPSKFDTVCAVLFVVVVLTFQWLITVGCFIKKSALVIVSCAASILLSIVTMTFLYGLLGQYYMKSWVLMTVPFCLLILDTMTLGIQLSNKKHLTDNSTKWGSARSVLAAVAVIYYIYTVDGVLNIGNMDRVGPWPEETGTALYRNVADM